MLDGILCIGFVLGIAALAYSNRIMVWLLAIGASMFDPAPHNEMAVADGAAAAMESAAVGTEAAGLAAQLSMGFERLERKRRVRGALFGAFLGGVIGASLGAVALFAGGLFYGLAVVLGVVLFKVMNNEAAGTFMNWAAGGSIFGIGVGASPFAFGYYLLV